MTRQDAVPAMRAALDAADRRERMGRTALYAAALLEAVLLGAALLVMDFGNRTHLLILICAVLSYSTLGLGLAAVAARSSAENARLLQALQLLGDRSPA